MDGFEEDLFDVFTTPAAQDEVITTAPNTTAPIGKRVLTQETIDNVSKKAKTIIDTHAATAREDKNENDPNQLVSLTGGKTLNALPSAVEAKTQAQNILQTSANDIISSAKLATQEYDVFDGYYEQVVVGSDKPENVKDQTQKTCAMQVCYPPKFDIEEYEARTVKELTERRADPDFKPAKTYPFVLDPFQAKAVDCIEKNQSVLVAAHTSAGKTVVAEYAIAKALKLGQRVIYTSPIKALSNQKYRELQAEFKDVGLMTGDVTINSGASCLVMTTEILRNMLYRGSEVLREISWVIFDEVHYMRDRSRGVVWEETIILLPHKCRFVFLSATLLNSAEFACWVAKLHNQPCSVIYTNYRPTPLEHHVFARGSDGIHLIVDKVGEFKDANFQKVLSALSSTDGDGHAAPAKDAGADGQPAKKKKQPQGTSEDEVEMIVRKVKELELDPCIVFSFSKKDCERYAKNMMKVDFCTDQERELIGTIYKRAIESLTEQDQRLPQVQEMAPLLKKGIGVHHGGLLPILKEIVELLFQEGLLRVLFSTETFSIGLNMPARTVVFTSMFKWDGVTHRALTSGEYIQMSGRAGRRGLDDKGVVILMLSSEVETNVVKAMMAGPSDPLLSSFRLGYNMLLNLFRLEETDPDYLMTRSFYQFQQQRVAPVLSAAIEAVQQQRTELIDNIRDTISRQMLILKALNKDKNGNNKKGGNNNTNTKSTATKDDPTAINHPIIQLHDIQQYTALYKNLSDQRYLLRSLLYRPEVLRGFFTNKQQRLVNIRGCIREGPPPLLGSAAALALEQSYNNPVPINNDDPAIAPLTLSTSVATAFQALRQNRALLDGSNASQAQNAGLTNVSLVKRDDMRLETGAVPPGLDQSQAQLAQLATANKSAFITLQQTRLLEKEINFGWGVVVNVAKRSLPECVLYGASTPLPPSTVRPGQRQPTVAKEGSEVTIFEVLLPVDPDCVLPQHERFIANSDVNLLAAYALHEQVQPCPAHKKPKYIIVPVLASAISAISTICLKIDSVKMHSDRQTAGTRLERAIERLTEVHQGKSIDYKQFDPETAPQQRPAMFPLSDAPIPQLDLFSELNLFTPVNADTTTTTKSGKDNKDANNKPTGFLQQCIGDPQKLKDLLQLNNRIARLHQQLTNAKLHNHPLRVQLWTNYQHKVRLDAYLQWLQYKLQGVSRDQTLRNTLVSMKRVLKALQLITDREIITSKGRVACELSTCDELVGTELLYSSIFNPLNIKQLAALCSCLVFDEGSLGHDDTKPKLGEDLQAPYNQLEEHLKNVAGIIKDAAIPIDINKYVQSFNPFLMHVVFQWCEGASFAEIMKQSGNVFEGTVIRVMRRLEELLKQFAVACEALGNTELQEKFNQTVVRLKRDIVFAASLYL